MTEIYFRILLNEYKRAIFVSDLLLLYDENER